MPEFSPVTTIVDLYQLDEQDVAAGFAAGFHGEPEPLASVYSRAWWHGWRLGQVHAGITEPPADLVLLAFIADPPSLHLH